MRTQQNKFDSFLEAVPGKFHPRPEQRKILQIMDEVFIRDRQQALILTAPTGVGKSLIGITASEFFGRAWIITVLRILQDQYFKDFNFVRLLKGAAAYACDSTLFEGLSTCNTVGSVMGYCPGCRYKRDLEIALSEDFKTPSLANIHSFLFNISKAMMRNIIVFDEAHCYEQTMYDILSHTYTEEQLRRLDAANVSPNRPLSYAREKLEEMKSRARVKKGKLVVPRIDGFRITDLSQLMLKATIWESFGLSMNRVELPGDDTMLYPNSIKNCLLFLSNKGQRQILMSATMVDPDHVMNVFGLPAEKTVKLESGSSFPTSHRPFILYPRWQMKSADPQSPVVAANYVAGIARIFQHEKGCVHVPSYRFAEQIVEELKKKGQDIARRILFDRTAKIEELLERHREKPESIVISPAIYHGVSMDDDDARWQVITKVPFADLGDVIVQHRKQYDPDSYNRDAMTKIVQAYGRSTRHNKDKSITVCLDRNLSRVRRSANPPEFFEEAVIEIKNDSDLEYWLYRFKKELPRRSRVKQKALFS